MGNPLPLPPSSHRGQSQVALFCGKFGNKNAIETDFRKIAALSLEVSRKWKLLSSYFAKRTVLHRLQPVTALPLFPRRTNSS